MIILCAHMVDFAGQVTNFHIGNARGMVLTSTRKVMYKFSITVLFQTNYEPTTYVCQQIIVTLDIYVPTS